MKFSEAWLRSLIDPPVDTHTLASQLTMLGLEVDSVEPAGPALPHVVIAHIDSVIPHPNADTLRVCQVNVGATALQIVCGAPNARPGLLVPCALEGAELPGGMRIGRAKIRGVESNGMLCAADELGLTAPVEFDGLWELPADAPVGESFASWLDLNDQLIEVDLTPNRADCLSLLGLARELALINNLDMNPLAVTPVAPVITDQFAVQVTAQEGCPRYLSRVVRGVDLTKATPQWMTERLRRSGIRSIDPAVDVTNYVMLELGQPMHAFDLGKIRKGIEVRYARTGESMVLLDGKKVDLQAGTLLIADAERPLAIAGIMGGEDSSVGEHTQDILLESAYFSPAALAGKARYYGMHTEASHRFERGVDSALQERAIERATALLLSISGGQAGPVSRVESPLHFPPRPEIKLRRARAELVLGQDCPANQIEEILRGLGCEIKLDGIDEWLVKAPTWRFDIALEVDLIEEIARVRGYDQIIARPMVMDSHLGQSVESIIPMRKLAHHLIARGFREVISYSFVSPELAVLTGSQEELIPVVNPIAAELGVMRPSVLAGLLSTAAHNFARQEDYLRIFETGLSFRKMDGRYQQKMSLALLMAGRAAPESWNDNRAEVDFYQASNELAALAQVSGISLEFSPLENDPLLHPGQAATILSGGIPVGRIGMLHPGQLRQLELPASVALLEIYSEALVGAAVATFTGVSRFPSVRRDIALLVDRDCPVADLSAIIKQTASHLLAEVRVFDIYQGHGIDSNKKSVALGLTFRDKSRTLIEEEVNEQVRLFLDELMRQKGAQQR